MKKMNLKMNWIIALFVLAIFVVSCDKSEDLPAPAENVELKSGQALPPGEEPIAAIAISAGFSELVSALFYVDQNVEPSPGLVNLFLEGKDQYTVFAPTNDAFFALYDALNVDAVTDLPAGLVYNVLLYHVTDGRRASNSVVPKKNPKTIETLLEDATFMVDSDKMITAVGNTANITTPDISASNGIIHIIDAVILPIVPE